MSENLHEEGRKDGFNWAENRGFRQWLENLESWYLQNGGSEVQLSRDAIGLATTGKAEAKWVGEEIKRDVPEYLRGFVEGALQFFSAYKKSKGE